MALHIIHICVCVCVCVRAFAQLSAGAVCSVDNVQGP